VKNSSKTEDEEDEDNPFDERMILAQTSDGRKNDLKRALSRFATNVEDPNRDIENNAQEEEKRISQSSLNENLEICCNTNAPILRKTFRIPKPGVHRSESKFGNESFKEPKTHRSNVQENDCPNVVFGELEGPPRLKKSRTLTSLVADNKPAV
jgi:hypothetical protein